MVQAWPGTINQRVMYDSYREQPETNKLTFQPEVGPPIERRRSGISTDVISFNGAGTVTEWSNLKTFFRTTCIDGTDTFTRTHPLTGSSATFKFTEPPRLLSIRNARHEWQLSVRLMP